MSIAAVCVDRGRVIRDEPSGRRVEGRTQFVPVPEQWFKCRLFATESNNVTDAQGGHTTSVSAPQVLCVAKDLDGVALDFHGDEAIDINSKEFGRYVWKLTGEPQPIRKKRRVIGWVLNVNRVIERTYDDLLNDRAPDIGAPPL